MIPKGYVYFFIIIIYFILQFSYYRLHKIGYSIDVWCPRRQAEPTMGIILYDLKLINSKIWQTYFHFQNQLICSIMCIYSNIVFWCAACMCATTLSIFPLVTWPYVALSTVLPFQKYVSVDLPSCPCTLNARVGLATLILYVSLVPSFIPSTGKEQHIF